MTDDEYFARVRLCGLTRSRVPNVYFDRHGIPANVPNPAGRTDSEKQAILNRIIQLHGAGDQAKD